MPPPAEYRDPQGQPWKCPACPAVLIVKQGPWGVFLACPHFPQCRGTRNVDGTLGEAHQPFPNGRTRPPKRGPVRQRVRSEDLDAAVMRELMVDAGLIEPTRGDPVVSQRGPVTFVDFGDDVFDERDRRLAEFGALPNDDAPSQGARARVAAYFQAVGRDTRAAPPATSPPPATSFQRGDLANLGASMDTLAPRRATSDADRCNYFRCQLARVPNTSFCAAHDPATRGRAAATPAIPPVLVGTNAQRWIAMRHPSHSPDPGPNAPDRHSCDWCGRRRNLLRTPCRERPTWADQVRPPAPPPAPSTPASTPAPASATTPSAPLTRIGLIELD